MDHELTYSKDKKFMKMKKLLQNIQSNDVIKELNPFQTEQEWVDFMLKLLNSNNIHTVQDFVFRSHSLTKVMADKVVDIINYHAVQSYARSLQDNARKNAFIEANVSFESVPDDLNYHPKINGVKMPQTSIKMCKKKHFMMEMNGMRKKMN